MPKIVDHDRRRAELAEVAFHAFAETGYAATSMRALAERAGVSTGTLYHYFPDKSAILAQMFAAVVAADQARFAEDVPMSLPVAERLPRLLAYVQRNAPHLRDVVRVALEVHRHAPVEGSLTDLRLALQGYRDSTAQALDLDDGGLIRVAFAYLVGSLIQDLLDPPDHPGVPEGLLAGLWAQFAAPAAGGAP